MFTTFERKIDYHASENPNLRENLPIGRPSGNTLRKTQTGKTDGNYRWKIQTDNTDGKYKRKLRRKIQTERYRRKIQTIGGYKSRGSRIDIRGGRPETIQEGGR